MNHRLPGDGHVLLDVVGLQDVAQDRLRVHAEDGQVEQERRQPFVVHRILERRSDKEQQSETFSSPPTSTSSSHFDLKVLRLSEMVFPERNGSGYPVITP